MEGQDIEKVASCSVKYELHYCKSRNEPSISCVLGI